MFDSYPQYRVGDFVRDDAFIRWVHHPTPATDAYWKQFLEAYPQRRADVEQARSWVLALAEANRQPVSAEEPATLWASIDNQLTSSKTLNPFRRWPAGRWVAAASVAGLLLLGGLWWLNQSVDPLAAPDAAGRVSVRPADVPQESFRNVGNPGRQPLAVRLPDGSRVILQPNSTLRYASDFLQNTREVHLTGAAFFDVTRNPQKPFLVYADNLVTKVLGTSFWVKATETERVIVSVRTGLVSVFARGENEKQDPEVKGVLLTPNQQVVFERDRERFTRSLVEQPVLLIKPEQLPQFVFDNAPVSQIFEAVERAYGVEVVYDKALFANCTLTTSLTTETLHEKLAVICRGIEATYKVVDAQVVVTGAGCD